MVIGALNAHVYDRGKVFGLPVFFIIACIIFVKQNHGPSPHRHLDLFHLEICSKRDNANSPKAADLEHRAIAGNEY